MGELLDRRAHKKARTRAEIRTVAQQLFAARGFEAVTIADIATEARVAVQTVFNHFATKEELFFDGRTPWVAGAAEAVRARPAGTAPLRALQEYLVRTVAHLVEAHASAERRSYVATIEASPALRSHELGLVAAAERQLTAALVAAWSAPGEDGAVVPDDPETTAGVVAATWLAAARVLLSRQRSVLGRGPEARRTAEQIESVAERVFAQLERNLGMLDAAVSALPGSSPGWPAAETRRAG